MNTLEELHEAIRDEIDGIWTKEPEDIRALRRGFMPSGAGVYGLGLLCDRRTLYQQRLRPTHRRWPAGLSRGRT